MKRSYTMNGRTVEVDEVDGLVAVQHPPVSLPTLPWPPGAGIWSKQLNGWRCVASDRDTSRPRHKLYRQGDQLVIGSQVSAQMLAPLTPAEVEAVAARYGCRITYRFQFAANLVTLQPEGAGVIDVVALADQLGRDRDVMWAEPVMIEEIGHR